MHMFYIAYDMWKMKTTVVWYTHIQSHIYIYIHIAYAIRACLLLSRTEFCRAPWEGSQLGPRMRGRPRLSADFWALRKSWYRSSLGIQGPEWSFFTRRWETSAKQVRFTSCRNLQTRLVTPWEEYVKILGMQFTILDLWFTIWICLSRRFRANFTGLLSDAAFQTKRIKNLLPRMKCKWGSLAAWKHVMHATTFIHSARNGFYTTAISGHVDDSQGLYLGGGLKRQPINL